MRVGYPTGANRAAAERLLEFLGADKGKRVVRRVFPRLTEAQRLLFFGALIRVFDRLDVVSTPIQSQVPYPTKDGAAPHVARGSPVCTSLTGRHVHRRWPCSWTTSWRRWERC